MSASPTNEDAVDKLPEDVAEDAQAVEGDEEPTTPVKRGRGRPKGSKNKKASDAAPSAGPSVNTGEKRKRGRPPKPKPEGEEANKPKRPRGRPPKNPKPAAKADEAGEDGEPPKKKRGRPPKNATAED